MVELGSGFRLISGFSLGSNQEAQVVMVLVPGMRRQGKFDQWPTHYATNKDIDGNGYSLKKHPTVESHKSQVTTVIMEKAAAVDGSSCSISHDISKPQLSGLGLDFAGVLEPPGEGFGPVDGHGDAVVARRRLDTAIQVAQHEEIGVDEPQRLGGVVHQEDPVVCIHVYEAVISMVHADIAAQPSYLGGVVGVDRVPDAMGAPGVAHQLSQLRERDEPLVVAALDEGRELDETDAEELRVEVVGHRRGDADGAA
ncbi:hypothetical protein PG985_007894 [Apiospora marii]|uniref:Uncharacterized protein n=1 Tax=Apiospora marii TaxID=335849 RepID=A0ABR1R947_9PEZI